MTALRAALYVASWLLELGGLGLVVVGVRAGYRSRQQLLAQRDAMEPQDANDRFYRTGLGGAEVNAQIAVEVLKRQIALHADELATGGRLSLLGAALFALGTTAGLAANLFGL